MRRVAPAGWRFEKDGPSAVVHSIPELYRLLEVGAASAQDRVRAEDGTEWISLAEALSRADAGASDRPAQLGRSNYILRHWRGELPLVISYWTNFVLLGAVAGVAGRLMTGAGLFEGQAYYAVAIAITAMVGGSLLLAAWQIVGTWRSSDRHVSRGGRRGWAMAAKVVMVISAASLGVQLQGSEAPAVVTLWRKAAIMSRMPPTRFEVLRGGAEITFIGGVHAGSAAEFRALLDQNPAVRTIHLESPGGLLQEGHAVAAIIRARGLDTYIRGQCFSACTLMFLAGRNRYLKDGAQIGFHAPSSGVFSPDGADLIEAERQALLRTGVPEWFVERTFSTRFDEMWIPSVEELRSAQVITDVTNGRAFSPGLPLPPVSEADAAAEMRTTALGRALEAMDHAAFRALVSALPRIVNDGGTEGDVALVVQGHVMPVFNRSVPVLPDRQIVSTMRTIRDVAWHLQAVDARLCRDWLMHKAGQPVPHFSPYLPASLRESLVQVMTDVLTTAADPQRRVPVSDGGALQLDLVLRRLAARLSPAEMAIFTQLDRPSHDPQALCAVFIAFYDEIFRLPDRQSGPLLRFLTAGG